jgi:hypothetical protein
VRWVSLAFSAVLVIGVFGSLAVLRPESFTKTPQTLPSEPVSLRSQTFVTAMTVASNGTQPTDTTAAAAHPLFQNNQLSQECTLDHDHSLHQPNVVGFASLPAAIQQEVRTLNSKNNDDIVVEQVTATLYSASIVGVHQAVPVAVINDDGSVSISEY